MWAYKIGNEFSEMLLESLRTKIWISLHTGQIDSMVGDRICPDIWQFLYIFNDQEKTAVKYIYDGEVTEDAFCLC